MKNKKFISNIVLLRHKKDLTQERAAKKLGISRAALGAYEEGRNEPSLELLIKFSKFYRISLDDLILGNVVRGYGRLRVKWVR